MSCENSHASCVDWAKAGECENNRDYMHQACRLACGLCDDDTAAHAEEKIPLSNMDLLVGIGTGVVVILATIVWLLMRRRSHALQVPLAEPLREQRLRRFGAGPKAAATPGAPVAVAASNAQRAPRNNNVRDQWAARSAAAVPTQSPHEAAVASSAGTMAGAL